MFKFFFHLTYWNFYSTLLQNNQDDFNELIREHFTAIKKQDLFEVMKSFESIFSTKENNYKWPLENAIVSDIVGNDEVLSTVYKVYGYRHNYARIPDIPTSSERNNAYENCYTFLKLVSLAPQPVQLELPDILLWEIIDDFVSLHLDHNGLDNNRICFDIFNRLINKSNIKSGGDPESVSNQFARHSLYKMLGFFSLVEMLRLQLLCGDYDEVIKVLEPIEIHKGKQYTYCTVTIQYYVGFAYMMMRRYTDAIRKFSSILLYIQEQNQLYSIPSYQNDQINKQTDQMYRLLLICLILCPQHIHESIKQELQIR